MYSFPNLEPVHWFMSGSDCCFLTCIQVPQEAGKVVWYSHHLLLGIKAMTKLDSIIKSRDITLLTKVHLFKAVVFLVVMYGCESWTIKKPECQNIDAFELWYWRRLLSIP